MGNSLINDSEPKYFICMGGRGNGRSLRLRQLAEMLGYKRVIVMRKGEVYMKDYEKVIRDLQATGNKLCDKGEHELGHAIYLAAVDFEDVWTQYKAMCNEIKKLQEKEDEHNGTMD